MNKTWLLVGCALLCAGCSTTSYGTGAADRPLAPMAPRVVSAEDTKAAVESLCDVLAQRNAQGWSAHVLVRDGLPVVRVLEIEDASAGFVSAAGVRNELIDRLVNRRLAHVLGTDADLDAVWLERDYARAGVTDAPIPSGTEDPTALVIRGELSSEPTGRDRIDVSLQLRAIDTVKSQVVASARRSFSCSVPADRVGMAEIVYDTGMRTRFGYNTGTWAEVRRGSDSLAQVLGLEARLTGYTPKACAVKLHNKSLSTLRLEYSWHQVDEQRRPLNAQDWTALDLDPEDTVWVNGGGATPQKRRLLGNSSEYEGSLMHFKVRFRLNAK